MSDFISEGSYQKARKKYRCNWCNRDIKVGMEYYQDRGVTDGRWQSWRAHGPCLAAWDTHRKDHPECQGAYDHPEYEMIELFGNASVWEYAMVYFPTTIEEDEKLDPSRFGVRCHFAKEISVEEILGCNTSN